MVGRDVWRVNHRSCGSRGGSLTRVATSPSELRPLRPHSRPATPALEKGLGGTDLLDIDSQGRLVYKNFRAHCVDRLDCVNSLDVPGRRAAFAAIEINNKESLPKVVQTDPVNVTSTDAPPIGPAANLQRWLDHFDVRSTLHASLDRLKLGELMGSALPEECSDYMENSKHWLRRVGEASGLLRDLCIEHSAGDPGKISRMQHCEVLNDCATRDAVDSLAESLPEIVDQFGLYHQRMVSLHRQLRDANKKNMQVDTLNAQLKEEIRHKDYYWAKFKEMQQAQRIQGMLGVEPLDVPDTSGADDIPCYTESDLQASKRAWEKKMEEMEAEFGAQLAEQKRLAAEAIAKLEDEIARHLARIKELEDLVARLRSEKESSHSPSSDQNNRTLAAPGRSLPTLSPSPRGDRSKTRLASADTAKHTGDKVPGGKAGDAKGSGGGEGGGRSGGRKGESGLIQRGMGLGLRTGSSANSLELSLPGGAEDSTGLRSDTGDPSGEGDRPGGRSGGRRDRDGGDPPATIRLDSGERGSHRGFHIRDSETEQRRLAEELKRRVFEQVIHEERRRQARVETEDEEEFATWLALIGASELVNYVRQVETLTLRRDIFRALKNYRKFLPQTLEIICVYCRRKPRRDQIHSYVTPNPQASPSCTAAFEMVSEEHCSLARTNPAYLLGASSSVGEATGIGRSSSVNSLAPAVSILVGYPKSSKEFASDSAPIGPPAPQSGSASGATSQPRPTSLIAVVPRGPAFPAS